MNRELVPGSAYFNTVIDQATARIESWVQLPCTMTPGSWRGGMMWGRGGSFLATAATPDRHAEPAEQAVQPLTL